MGVQSFRNNFINLVNAGFPYLYISTYEENRVQNELNSIVCGSNDIKTPRAFFSWTQTDGLVKLWDHNNEKVSSVSNTKDPIKAIENIEKNPEPGVYIFKDIHVFFGGERGTHPDHLLVRKLRDVIPTLQANRKNIVLLCPKLVIPSDMEKDISILDFGFPDEDEITSLLEELCHGLLPEQVDIDESGKQLLVRAALGLTLQEAENAFCRAIVSNKGLSKDAVKIIYEEKNQVVKKTGVLEFIKTDLGIDDVGGLENLKNWLIKRNNTWTEKAKSYNLPSPKGVLVTGVPGCGKSLTAKAMSVLWGLPLLKLDMGKIFGGVVGSSEANMRKAIDTAEAVAPSILWVDEIEKGFTGVKSSGDSGTSARVFGTFLTWLQDKEKPVFVVATANDIEALPPELLRKGRFDEIFFVDLPTLKEREKIFAVHINKLVNKGNIQHEVAADEKTVTDLAKLTDGFTGSEIEQIIISAMFEAYYKNRGMTKDDIKKAINETVPIAVTQREQIISLRKWAKERAVLATAADDRDSEGKDDSEEINGSTQSGRLVSFDL